MQHQLVHVEGQPAEEQVRLHQHEQRAGFGVQVLDEELVRQHELGDGHASTVPGHRLAAPVRRARGLVVALGGMNLLAHPIARLDGTPSTLAEITGGQPALLVNVASRCGFTQQYAALEELHRSTPTVASPWSASLQPVRGQEPGSAEEIAEFCSTTFGVTFPMTEKVEVNGPGRHPVCTTSW